MIKRLTLIAGITCALLSGCGGGGGGGGGSKSVTVSIGGVTLMGSNGYGLGSSPLASSHALAGTITGLKPYDQAIVCVNAPFGTAQATPFGLPSCSFYETFKSDKTGSIPLTTLTPRLPAGSYSLSVYDLTSRSGTNASPVLKMSSSFTVADSPATTPSATTGYLTAGQFSPNDSFLPGDTIYVSGAGLPKSSTVYVYVVAHKAVWSAGDRLVDVAGYVAYTPPNLPLGTKIAFPKLMRGTALPVTTSSTGSFAPAAVWTNLNAEAENQFFDVIVDVHGNGVFDPTADLLADSGEGSFTVTAGTRGGPISAKLAYNSAQVSQTVFNIPDTPYTHYGSLPNAAEIAKATKTKGTMYVCKHQATWSAGDPLVDVSGPNGTSNPIYLTVFNGNPYTSPTVLDPPDLLPGEYDVIIDPTQGGVFDPSTDILDGGASPSFTVQSTVPTAKWTVMVYMDADNNLAPDAVTNMLQMEKVVYGANPQVTVVVQWAQSQTTATGYPAGCRRYIMTHGSNPAIINTQPIQNLGTVDMAVPANLTSFIAWGKTVAPATNYALVLWDHGSGVTAAAKPKAASTRAGPVVKPSALLWDDGADDSMQVPAAHDAIQAAGGVNLLATDMCLMGSVELAYEMKDVCTTYVGSATLVPGMGYPYDTILGALVATPTMTDQTLGNTIVTKFGQLYTTTSPDTYTCAAVDESKMVSVATAISVVSAALLAPTGDAATPNFTQPGNQDALFGLSVNLQDYGQGDSRFTAFKDAQDLFNKIGAAGIGGNVTAACTGATSAIQSCILSESHSSNYTDGHGLSLYYGTGGQYMTDSPAYALLTFGLDSTWPTFLNQLWSVQFVNPFPFYVDGEVGKVSVTPSQETGRSYVWAIAPDGATVSDGTNTSTTITTPESTCTLAAALDAAGTLNLTVTASETIGATTFTIGSTTLPFTEIVTHPGPAVVYNYVDASDATKGTYAVAYAAPKVANNPYLRTIYYQGANPIVGDKYLLSAPSAAIDPDNQSGPGTLGLTPLTLLKKIKLNGSPAPNFSVYDFGDRALMIFQTFPYDSNSQDAMSANAVSAASSINIDSAWFATLTAN